MSLYLIAVMLGNILRNSFNQQIGRRHCQTDAPADFCSGKDGHLVRVKTITAYCQRKTPP